MDGTSHLHIQRERVADAYAEALPLMRRHYIETGEWTGGEPDLDLELYSRMQDQGVYQAFVARVGGAMVGYAGFFVSRNPHDKAGVDAMQDGMWLLPDHRRGMTGVRLIRFCDQVFAAEGVRTVVRQVTPRRDYSRLLVRMGYQAIETSYARKLQPATADVSTAGGASCPS